jgi:hypothetical protein
MRQLAGAQVESYGGQENARLAGGLSKRRESVSHLRTLGAVRPQCSTQLSNRVLLLGCAGFRSDLVDAVQKRVDDLGHPLRMADLMR